MAVSGKGGRRRRVKTRIFIDPKTLATEEAIRALVARWVVPQLVAEFAASRTTSSDARAEAEKELQIAA